MKEELSASLHDKSLNEYKASSTSSKKNSDIKLLQNPNYVESIANSSNNTEESAIESSEGESSLGSEFGESHNTNSIQSKFPQVKKDIAAILKIHDPEILNDKINLTIVTDGTVICKEGDYNCSLVFVLDGMLKATQKELNGDEVSLVFN